MGFPPVSNRSVACGVAVIVLFVSIACTSVDKTSGQAQANGSTTTAKLNGFPHDTVGVYSFRFSEMWRHPLIRGFRERKLKEVDAFIKTMSDEFGMEPAKIDRLTLLIPEPNTQTPIMDISTIKPYDRKRLLAAFGPDAKTQKVDGKSIHTNQQGRSICLLDKNRYLVGAAGDLSSYLKALNKFKDNEYTKAVRELGDKHQVVAGINLARLRRLIANDSLVFFKSLLKARFATFTLDLDNPLTGRVAIYFDGKKQAADNAALLQQDIVDTAKLFSSAIVLVKSQQSTKKLFTVLDQSVWAYRNARVEQKDKTLRIKIVLDVKPKTIIDAVVHTAIEIRTSTARQVSVDKLRRLGIALHTYHEVHKHLPRYAVVDKNAKPLLSWRVVILPFVGEEKLFEQFRLHEPWDSAHNKRLLARMPEVFALTDDNKKEFTTHYQAVIGNDTIFDGTKKVSLQNITDGLSNTIMLVEAAKAVPWTKPQDMEYAKRKPLPKFGGFYEGGFNVLLADGATSFIHDSIPPITLHRLIQRNDGMPE